MGYSVTQNAAIPIGKSLQESRKLLDQTAAALAVTQSGTLDFSGIEDISGIVNSAVSGNLLTEEESGKGRRTRLGVLKQIFQAGGIDKPLITKRRSRLCIGVRATHKYLIPNGVILDVSGSGATYFMEPGDAVELNNFEVMLSNSEKAEEIAILSLLTSEIAESEGDIKYLLDGILELDLAFARAAYAQQMNGVHPILTSEDCEGGPSNRVNYALSIDIEGIQHPLLLGSSQRSLSEVFGSNSEKSAELDDGDSVMATESLSKRASEFPVPINIKWNVEPEWL
ncbi:hypothetical protein GH714_002202 [Hevea brasiliensis]|uniref:Uncharacterized protein n=1 Tax=Hevea brasiliensis TaxID=3981 RepID=A0A6A6L8B3_HEVBR|nr:hypothetical protein GH714_002202 [Hevea brasiliensis]